MIGINLEILLVAEKIFNKLICRLHGFKAVERDCVLYSGVVGIEGDDIVHTHFYKLLKCDGTVQGFTAGTFMLSAFIEERHDNIDSSGLASHGGYDTLQILEMIIR